MSSPPKTSTSVKFGRSRKDIGAGCGTRTEAVLMPWIAEEAWNRGDFLETQYSLF